MESKISQGFGCPLRNQVLYVVSSTYLVQLLKSTILFLPLSAPTSMIGYLKVLVVRGGVFPRLSIIFTKSPKEGKLLVVELKILSANCSIKIA